MTNLQAEKLLGWKEWIVLPELQLPPIKAKVDTGAKTTCLHAFEINPEWIDDQEWIEFKVHPLQNNVDEIISCRAPVHDKRPVTDSGGHTEERYVIKTPIRVGDWQHDVEITLTARDNMRFRALLGRNAMISGHFIVNPGQAHLQNKP